MTWNPEQSTIIFCRSARTYGAWILWRYRHKGLDHRPWLSIHLHRLHRGIGLSHYSGYSAQTLFQILCAASIPFKAGSQKSRVSSNFPDKNHDMTNSLLEWMHLFFLLRKGKATLSYWEKRSDVTSAFRCQEFPMAGFLGSGSLAANFLVSKLHGRVILGIMMA